ncbi:MAG: glutamate--tRNA ligase family protein [Armatimonadota bacterium]|nr:glutamate--tRNA ligase family protein [Armatimonadota bacterium]
MSTTVRTRIPPSPTGYIHVGNAWAAFFNWLYARRHGGQVVLRIEDTDRTRSRPEFEQAIYEDLRWLGIDWDEGPDVGGPNGPYRQTERTDLYRQTAEELVRRGAAYPCYCTPEEIDADRERAQAEHRPYRYSGRCRDLSAAEVAALEAAGRRPALRFNTERFRDPALTAPDGWLQARRHDGEAKICVVVHDLIRGEVLFHLDDIDDFIIVRSDGSALYNFANVTDDHGMAITHIMRGLEHLSNTPRQLLMYHAAGWDPPQFAHLPVLLGPDRKKLSKRHGDTALRDYRDELYLPEAMRNFFALMGWYPEDGREIFSTEELVARFDIAQVGRASPIFDRQKLVWMNGEYMRRAMRDDPERVVDLVTGYLVRRSLLTEPVGPEVRDYVRRVVEVLGERLKTGEDVVTYGDFFFLERPRYDEAAVTKYLRQPGAGQVLREASEQLGAADPFAAAHIERVLRALASERDLEMRAIVHPLRVALTGKTVGPGLFELIEVLGKDRVVRRLADAQALAGGAA